MFKKKKTDNGFKKLVTKSAGPFVCIKFVIFFNVGFLINLFNMFCYTTHQLFNGQVSFKSYKFKYCHYIRKASSLKHF